MAGAIALVYFVVAPLLHALILALVFAFLFHPVYEKLQGFLRGHDRISALLTTILLLVVIILPIAFFGIQIFKESSDFYTDIANGHTNGIIDMFSDSYNRLREFAPMLESMDTYVNQLIQWGSGALLENIGLVFTNITKIILYLLIFIAAFYFLLKDGYKLKEYFFAISPLKNNDNNLILARLETTVYSVIRGSLVVAVIQGTLASIGFLIFGVPHALLWGSVTIISSLVPGVGTALVIGPAVVYLYVTGNTFGSIGLLIWGLLAVGLIDNFLGPKLVGSGMHLHPFVVFIMVIGGLAFFGPLGFLFGPLVMILCLTLIDIYSSLTAHMKKHHST